MADQVEGNEASEQDNDEVVTLWAMVRYEEGTSGALKTVEGVLIDDSAGITVLDPETGAACIIGDRFIVRVDLAQVDDEDDDEDIDPDQGDTSADRFRA